MRKTFKTRTILMYTIIQHLDEIGKISDRVGILADGIIKKLGTPRELKAQAEGGIGLAVRTKPALTAAQTTELSKV